MNSFNTQSNFITESAVVDEGIKEELAKVRAERDFYHDKLMRVKDKLSEGRRTTPQEQRRVVKQKTPKSSSRSKENKKPVEKQSESKSTKSQNPVNLQIETEDGI